MQSGKVSQAFRAAKHAAGRLAKTSAVIGGLLATPALAQDANINSVPLPKVTTAIGGTLDMDGFKIVTAPRSQWRASQRADADRYYAAYLKEKAEFDVAFNRCLNGSDDCDPRVALIVEALQRISHEPSYVVQAAKVNVFTNTLLEDPQDQEAESHSHNFSFLTGVKTLRGACEQKNFLKFFMLDRLDIPRDLYQMVFETFTIEGEQIVAFKPSELDIRPHRIGHVVIEFNDAGRELVLDDHIVSSKDSEPLDDDTMWETALQNGHLFSARNQTNRTARNPLLNVPYIKLQPWVAITKDGAAIFTDPDPKSDSRSWSEEQTGASLNRFAASYEARAEMLDILRPAFAQHYQLKPEPKMLISLQ